ncbi:MAG TPA: RHS repeat-associated core domain-containing protein [Luteibacter sp.]|uniref:RHS repeat domain-containing protein n=1 Tax=Luteibacter sp. TaxID=1886636 RepID=UPI002C69C7DB|nr:RHS repeat-associated core domain-containing protein [Luteibacter sp.]HVI54182.1 RHS repeat-associated core domain-containing protein [Luteibacter sp.]
MTTHLSSLHARTPTLTVTDPRGLPVRTVAYHRRQQGDTVEAHVDRQSYDARGRLCAQWDARLWADGGEAGEPNQSTRHGLSGQSLRATSVDAGWRIALFDDAGQVREGWDGRGTHRRTDYDEQQRPLSTVEQLSAEAPSCVERFTYGAKDEGATNRCGRMVRHDDPAGSRDVGAYGLSGGALAVTQRFLAALTAPDWPVVLADRDALLETDAQGATVSYTTAWLYDAQGAAWRQIDAAGHTRRGSVDVAGSPLQVDFQPSGATAVTVVSAMAYDAFGRAISETAGNGVETRSTWSAVDGRLQQRQVARTGKLLQDIDYTCDPVGNITRIEDRAQPTAWFDGAQVDPVSNYSYDTLYRLIAATGRESVQAAIGPALPGLVLPGGGDGSRRRMYTQTYLYDAAGNLRTLSHTGSDQTQYTRTMAVAARSNRSLYQPAGAPPPDFVGGFDANGNQQLLDGPTMHWNARDQLQRVTQVVRAAANDEETYVYGGGGMRQRKVRTVQARAVTHVDEVRYLPGLELHRNTATGEVWEVASLAAGRGALRWLHWQANGGAALPPPQWRYSIDDHLGSSSLELDVAAEVISHEGYYPFGGTAWWAARSEIEASRKTTRYSGKERDASGLYYYGYRYYAPWLCRWISPDPAGDIDGLNRFSMVANRPVTLFDADGTVGEDRNLLDALDLAAPLERLVPLELQIQRDIRKRLRADPRDLAPLDLNRNVNPVYRTGVGAFGGWASFSAITREIIQQATDNKHEAKGPRKAELNKLTAHAGYYVHATKTLHAGFVNLPASLAKKNTFEGVELLGNIQFKATTTDALVDSISRAYEGAGAHYAAMKIISSARAREAPNPLHEDIRFTLRGHIDRTTQLSGAMNARNGVPGMHAEVQAYNHARHAGLGPGDYTIYTQKLDKNITEPTDFVACYNCTSLIPPTVPVYTERGNGWPTKWWTLGAKHHEAAGH